MLHEVLVDVASLHDATMHAFSLLHTMQVSTLALQTCMTAIFEPEGGAMQMCHHSAHLAGPHGLDMLALIVPDVDENIMQVPVGKRAGMSSCSSAAATPHAAAAAGRRYTVVLEGAAQTRTVTSPA
jgi:hypothetical protein